MVTGLEDDTLKLFIDAFLHVYVKTKTAADKEDARKKTAELLKRTLAMVETGGLSKEKKTKIQAAAEFLLESGSNDSIKRFVGILARNEERAINEVVFDHLLRAFVAKEKYKEANFLVNAASERDFKLSLSPLNRAKFIDLGEAFEEGLLELYKKDSFLEDTNKPLRETLIKNMGEEQMASILEEIKVASNQVTSIANIPNASRKILEDIANYNEVSATKDSISWLRNRKNDFTGKYADNTSSLSAGKQELNRLFGMIFPINESDIRARMEAELPVHAEDESYITVCDRPVKER